MKRQTLAALVCLGILFASSPKALCKQSQPTPANAGGNRVAIDRQEQAPPSNQPPGPIGVRKETAPSKQVEQVRRKVVKLGIARRVTVVLDNGNEYYGAISQIGEDSFQLDEIDLKQQIKIVFVDVKNVRNGFGDFNHLTGKRWRTGWHKAALVVSLAATGLLVAIIALAANARD